MSDEELDREYQRILEQERTRGVLPDEPAGSERRKHPRLNVTPGNLPVEIDPWVFAIDISISGMAFYSDEQVEVGKVVNINAGSNLFADVKVIDAHLEPSNSPDQPSRYRLHCEFVDENMGKEFLVGLKDLENSSSSS